MARPRQWGDDDTMQIKFTGGGSLTIAFKGNMFDLLPNERILITKLSDVIQDYNHAPDPALLAETKIEQP